ncbi:MAG: hypothetical protein JWQ63_1321 [Mucilaginibacter sp.]|jgi:hypothetical protein|nr:hypothetical protein [Mucilaginibacter sp.]
MTPKLLIRIAAVLIFIHGFGHTIGHSGWKKALDPVEQQVIQQMTGHKFPFMGVNRSLAEYFDGYGYACSIALFIIAVIFFIVAADLSASIKLAKKIILTLSIGLLFWAIDEWIFFFPFAAAITFLAFVSSIYAYYLLSKTTSIKVK